MISDKYIHSKVEDRIYAYWEKNKLFKPKKNSKKYSIVIPPPNVTGSLHMGHALNNSIQDFLVRYYRMNNYETLWQPGTDHAGIATQALVEKKLEKESLTKATLGREKFIEKVWEWKNEYGDIIINQLKKLGCSCDWSRNAFTMDKNLSKSVIKVFVELHKKKLIYKAEKLVNWDTVLKTAISDLEVDQREMNSKIYYIRYPIENSSEFITIATTRPETMLGDTAIAVNPKDSRYKGHVGKTVTIPIVGRKIKIIKDNYADPEQGTGALKITPAHDFNDYDVGKRNNLQVINILEKNGSINKNGIKEFVGLDRFEARKLLIKKLKEKNIMLEICPGSNIALGLYSSLEDHPINFLFKKNIPISISTDDPPFFFTSLSKEYEELYNFFDWGQETFNKINKKSLEFSFCDLELKEKLIQQL